MVNPSSTSSSVESSPIPGTWFETNTYGTKRKPEHHLATWSFESSPGVTLIAPDRTLYMGQLEVGMRAWRMADHLVG